MNKKKFLSSVLAAVIALGSTTAYAQESDAPSGTAAVTPTAEVSNALEDTYSDGVLVYTELSDGTYEVSGVEDKTLTGISIPATVNGIKVTLIGYRAFYDCANLTSVTIPDGVTSIERYAFYECSGLTSVTIPDSVTSIGESAFYGCSGLTSVIIPSSVTSIEEKVFWGCSGLTSVTIPNSVTSIEYEAFKGCSGLTSVTIPSSVTSIGAEAFLECRHLTSVNIPDSVTSIGANPFGDCIRLRSINVGDNNTEYCSVNGILFNKSKTMLIQFPGNCIITSYVIPDSVIEIGKGAFEDCKGLTSVIISNSVTSIGNDAFESCWKLTTIDIPNSVTSIGVGAFGDCQGLISINIPNSVTNIAGFTFFGCYQLPTVTIPSSVKSIGDDAFEYCNFTSVTIPNSVTSIGERSFSNCLGLTSVTIPYEVKTIGRWAFEHCKLRDVYYSGTEEQWEEISINTHNDELLNATIHYNSTGPTGTPVDVTVKAPDGIDVSGQTATVIVDNETKTITITDGLLDVSGLANGTYTFTFSAKNCVPRAYNVTVANGAANGLDGGVELYLLGDINGDGSIKMADVRLAFKATRNSSELTEYQFAVADASKDGSVKMADVRAIYKHTRGESLWS